MTVLTYIILFTGILTAVNSVCGLIAAVRIESDFGIKINSGKLLIGLGLITEAVYPLFGISFLLGRAMIITGIVMIIFVIGRASMQSCSAVS